MAAVCRTRGVSWRDEAPRQPRSRPEAPPPGQWRSHASPGGIPPGEPVWRWRHAQTQARLAYEEWARVGGESAYRAYRARQDLADAAQDELAWRAREPARAT